MEQERQAWAFGDPRGFRFSRQDFARVRRLIGSLAGIALPDHKHIMVYNRLARRLRARRMSDFGEYLDLVESPGAEERARFINALTTNLTSFFRESHHFDFLASHARARRGRAALRVWSSACSTGEEPYSAAIVLREAQCAAEIQATDIDTDVLDVARRAAYSAEAVESIDPERRRRFFLKGVGPNEGSVRLRREIRGMVRFSRRNLLLEPWPASERFDVIFCRNVMIYFGKDTQRQVLDGFIRTLRPGGLLFVGHSESYANGHPALRHCGKTIYERRPDDPGRVS
jgi:chemotaxis protein methyltransferase CheR